MTGYGRVRQSQQGNGDVAHNGGQGYAEYLAVDGGLRVHAFGIAGLEYVLHLLEQVGTFASALVFQHEATVRFHA